jgi:hypothetical protein
VLEEKVSLFLKNVAFKRRRVVKKGKTKKRKIEDILSDAAESGPNALPSSAGQRLTLLIVDPETKQWATERQIPAGDLLDMIEDDREALDGHDAARSPDEAEAGGQDLYHKTVEGYLSGIAELHRGQVSLLLPLFSLALWSI